MSTTIFFGRSLIRLVQKTSGATHTTKHKTLWSSTSQHREIKWNSRMGWKPTGTTGGTILPNIEGNLNLTGHFQAAFSSFDAMRSEKTSHTIRKLTWRRNLCDSGPASNQWQPTDTTTTRSGHRKVLPCGLGNTQKFKSFKKCIGTWEIPLKGLKDV